MSHRTPLGEECPPVRKALTSRKPVPGTGSRRAGGRLVDPPSPEGVNHSRARAPGVISARNSSTARRRVLAAT